MIKIIISIFFAILFSSCTNEEVVISMLLNNEQPVFYFKFLKAVKKPVVLSSVEIYEAKTRKLVWEISAFDPSVLFVFVDETPDGRRRPRKSGEIQYDQIKSAPLSEVTFGAIPEGFTQYYPTENRKPILNHNVEYIISVDGSGGRMLFTVDGKCRRISSTIHSEDHPLFKNVSSCLP